MSKMEFSYRKMASRRNPGHWLQVVEAGQGPAILFIHGAAGAWSNFRPQLEELSRTNRVVAPDLRGHGSSPWPGPCCIADFLSDLEELMEELPPTFDLVGHSFGGCLATLLATRHPGRVRSLSLLNTAGHIPRGFAYRFLQLFSGNADLLLRHSPGLISTNTEVSQLLLYRILKEWDVWDLYTGIDCPSQVVMGQFDPLIPVDLGHRAAWLLPQSRLHILPTGGHICMWEAPQLVNGWLRDLVDGPAVTRVQPSVAGRPQATGVAL